MKAVLGIVLALVSLGACRTYAPTYADGTHVSLDYLFELAQHDKKYEKVGSLASQRIQRGLHNSRYNFDRIDSRAAHAPDARRFLLVVTLAEYDSGHPRVVVLKAEIFRGTNDQSLWSHTYRAHSRGWDRAAYATADELVAGVAAGFASIEADKLRVP